MAWGGQKGFSQDDEAGVDDNEDVGAKDDVDVVGWNVVPMKNAILWKLNRSFHVVMLDQICQNVKND